MTLVRPQPPSAPDGGCAVPGSSPSGPVRRRGVDNTPGHARDRPVTLPVCAPPPRVVGPRQPAARLRPASGYPQVCTQLGTEFQRCSYPCAVSVPVVTSRASAQVSGGQVPLGTPHVVDNPEDEGP